MSFTRKRESLHTYSRRNRDVSIVLRGGNVYQLNFGKAKLRASYILVLQIVLLEDVGAVRQLVKQKYDAWSKAT